MIMLEFLAFTGIISVGVGLLSLVLGILLAIYQLFRGSDKNIKRSKQALMFGVLLWMIGFGACALQIHFYPLNVH
jgi:hypothetical protein